jgi:hypothetical protein
MTGENQFSQFSQLSLHFAKYRRHRPWSVDSVTSPGRGPAPGYTYIGCNLWVGPLLAKSVDLYMYAPQQLSIEFCVRLIKLTLQPTYLPSGFPSISEYAEDEAIGVLFREQTTIPKLLELEGLKYRSTFLDYLWSKQQTANSKQQTLAID